jgi:hypothetical protein
VCGKDSKKPPFATLLRNQVMNGKGLPGCIFQAPLYVSAWLSLEPVSPYLIPYTSQYRKKAHLEHYLTFSMVRTCCTAPFWKRA